MPPSSLILCTLVALGGSEAPLAQPAATFPDLIARDLLPAQDPAPAKHGWHFWVGLPSTALGVVSIVVSVGLAAEVAAHNSAVQDIVAQVESNQLTSAQYERLIVELDDHNRAGPKIESAQWALFVTGVLLAAGGGGLLLWDLLAPNATTDVTISLSPTTDGGGLVLFGGQW